MLALRRFSVRPSAIAFPSAAAEVSAPRSLLLPFGRHYATIGLPGTLPQPGMPGGTWSEHGINGRWSVVASCKDKSGVYRESSADLPYSFNSIANENGSLKRVSSYAKPEEVPVSGGAISGSYFLLGGPFLETSKDARLVFTADVANNDGEYVSSSVVIPSGSGFVDLQNNGGKLTFQT